jgi:outer membrane protein assembly factor BamA
MKPSRPLFAIAGNRASGGRLCLGIGLLLSLAGGGDCLAQDEPAAHSSTLWPELTAHPLIGNITIIGNTRTDDAVVLRELGLAPGDTFPEDRLDEIWDHLEDTGYFAFVDIEYEETEPGVVDLVVMVEEERTGHLAPLIEYDRRFKYLLGASFRDRNFRGKGETLQLRGAVYRIQRFEFSWQRPWLMQQGWLSGRVQASWERAPFVFRPTDYTRWRLTGALRTHLLSSLYLDTSLGYGGFEQRDTFQERASGDGQTGLVTRPAGWRERLVAGVELGWDTRDMLYYPLSGAFHRVRAQVNAGGGFTSFTELEGDLRQYVGLPWRHVLALHAFGRLVDHHVPIEDRLYWGGPETIRGYDYAVLEGEEAYLLTAEYRWPLFLMPISPRGHTIGMGVHFFVDCGDVWYDHQEPRTTRLGYGAGFHLSVSTLQFRFEIAWARDGEARFEFADHFSF